MNNKLELLKISMTYCPATGLYWTDTIPGLFTHQQALDYAKLLGMCLPTIDELELAYKNGLKFDNSYFWSSSARPEDFAYTFLFYCEYGPVLFYDHRDTQNGVRFVVESI